jgi:hypothetical protein
MTFGRRILGQHPEAVLATERETATRPPFPEIDAITTELVIAALEGKRVAVIEEREKRADLELPPLTGNERDAVGRVFTLPAQQARGAWFLPEEGAVRTGSANLPFHFSKYPRFAVGAARDEKASVAFGEDPDALYYWAVLDPLFAGLVAPFDLRGPAPPKGDASEQQEAWAEIESFYSAMGVDGGEPFRAMRYGNGWSRLRSAEQLAIKQALIREIRRSITGALGARYRAWTTGALIDRYYAKAKKSPPLMRQVLTKALQRTLCAFFGGDWLAFVRYLGEQPHPEEQIAAALPEPRLYVDANARATAVAEAHGIPAAEVERIIATFWASESSESPVHKRLEVFRQVWRAFDAAHAAQAPGMPSLWGFIEDFEHIDFEREQDADPRLYNRALYRERLPEQLLATVDHLWGGVFLSAYPEAIVTALDPYARMCATLGPALRFWNGLGLTAWFVAEGPSSRTDMKGAESYYEHDLDALEAMGCAVDRRVFAELITGEAALGPEEPIDEMINEKPGEDDEDNDLGITITLQTVTNRGYRRAGFERLRDVVTRYRRAWSDKYFEGYLRVLWETELKDTAREYNKLYEVKRKTPTLKQFAKYADEPTNRWFGGNVSQLYRALGEKSPVSPVRRRFLTERPARFAQRVFAAIGGVPTKWEDLAATIAGTDREKQDAAWRAHQDRVKLATLSVKYLQLREALDRPPTLKEFGSGSFYYLAPVLDPSLNEKWSHNTSARGVTAYEEMKTRVADVAVAWELYSAAIERCMAEQLRTSEA